MQVERLLQVLVAALVVLGATLSGIGQRSVGLPLVLLILAGTSIYVTDFRGWFRLNRWLANVLALGAVCYWLIGAISLDSQGQMFAVANLMAFLQVVLLFQQKHTSIYWQLALLSVGQVLVSSSLNLGASFGLVLVVYMFVGIATLSVLLMYREAVRLLRGGEPGAYSGRASRANSDSAQSRSVGGPAVILMGASGDTPARLLAGGLLKQTFLLSLGTLVLSALLFVFLPRPQLRARGWQEGAEDEQQVVGFSTEVTLGELGDVVQNRDLVMRAQFFVQGSNMPVQLEKEPLFRGTVVSNYRRSVWSHESERVLTELHPPSIAPPLVTQKITIEPLEEPILFGIFPIVAMHNDSRLRFDLNRHQLVRSRDRLRGKRIEFEIGTTGIHNGRQLPIMPAAQPIEAWERQRLLHMPMADRPDDVDPLTGLRAAAAQAVRAAGVKAGDRLGIARALETYLKESGEYGYSLEGQGRDTSLDPLEDFITRHRQGHCEYFAGALAMMLRSQGIPARLAIGFKGGDWNSIGGYYEVRQLHAHAWVEAFLDPGDFPETEDMVGREADVSGGGWLLLDPTSETAADLYATGPLAIWRQVEHYYDYAQVLWTRYVLGLDAQRQQSAIYEPLWAAVSGAFEALIEPEEWRGLVQSAADWFRENWFSWQGALATVGGLSSLALLVWISKLAWRTFWRRWHRVAAAQAGSTKSQLEFYRRFEAALAGFGLARLAGQTQHEFAVTAGGEFSESAQDRRLAALPRRVVDAFYRVRFGGRALDNLEAEAVEHALVELESASARDGIHSGRKNGRRRKEAS